jgi:hypothetical protein
MEVHARFLLKTGKQAFNANAHWGFLQASVKSQRKQLAVLPRAGTTENVFLSHWKIMSANVRKDFPVSWKTTKTNIFISDRHLYDLQEKIVTNQTCALLRLAKMEELVPFFPMATNSNAFVL